MNDENWEIVEGVEQYSNELSTNTYSLLSNTRTYSRYRDYNMTILGITVTG
ncbi:hypothetical protein IRB23M11_12500 [Alkalibacterium sp. m-11]